MDKPPSVIEEHLVRFGVTGGMVDVRFRHEMSAEDVGDLIRYLEVWEGHLLKLTDAREDERARTGDA